MGVFFQIKFQKIPLVISTISPQLTKEEGTGARIVSGAVKEPERPGSVEGKVPHVFEPDENLREEFAQF